MASLSEDTASPSHPKIAVILAAGRGERLRGDGSSTPKPLRRVHGVSLAERAMRTLLIAAPIEKFVISIGYEAKCVQKHFEIIAARLGVAVEFVCAEDWSFGNGVSALAAADATGEEAFLLTMSDHLFAPELVTQLIAHPPSPGCIHLAVDRDKSNIFDLNDVTRVRLADNRISEISKDLSAWDAADTGVFYCTPALYEALRESGRSGEYGLSAAVAILADRGNAIGIDVTGQWWEDVDTQAALQHTEEHLLLEVAGKSNDGPIAQYINRPISRQFTRVLVGKSITPNQISVGVFLIACIAAACMAEPSYWMLALGGLLAQLSSILDGCDGEIARLRYEQTDFGGWFDAVLDRYSDALLLMGLTWHAMYTNSAEACVIAGFAALIGTFLNSYTADKYDSLMRDKVQKKYRLGRDVRIFLVAFGAVLNQPLITLWLVALIMNLEVVRRIAVCWEASCADHAETLVR